MPVVLLEVLLLLLLTAFGVFGAGLWLLLALLLSTFFRFVLLGFVVDNNDVDNDKGCLLGWREDEEEEDFCWRT